MKIAFNPINFNNYNVNFGRGTNKKLYVPPVMVNDSDGDGIKKSGIDSKIITQEHYSNAVNNIPSIIFGDIYYPAEHFRLTLEEYLGDLVVNERNPGAPIESLVVGRKPRQSIKEKMLAKRLKSKKEAVSEINDLIRGRVTLNTGHSNEGDQVVTRLIKAVKQGRLRVAEITSYRPEAPEERRKYEYVKTIKLRELFKTATENGQNPTFKAEEKDTGYFALHIIFLIENGYRAELQIMGKDVARLKEIEDICYKIKCNKRVDPGFDPVVQAMKELKLRQNSALMDEYNRYTKEAYKYERLKASGREVSKDSESFLKLPEDSEIPHILDFNEVAQIAERVKKAKSQSSE